MCDWVHCNACFSLPESGKSFFLTSCGHMFCSNCTSSASKDQCKMCGQSCNVLALNEYSKKVKPEIELFFTDPTDLIKKSLNQLVRVCDFQKNHRKILSVHTKSMMKKYELQQQQFQKVIEQFRKSEREIMLLKEENSYLKKLLISMGSQGSRNSPAKPTNSPSRSYVQRVMQTSPHIIAGGGAEYQPMKVTSGRVSLRQSPLATARRQSPHLSPMESSSHQSHTHTPRSSSGASSRSSVCPPPVFMPFTPNKPMTPSLSSMTLPAVGTLGH